MDWIDPRYSLKTKDVAPAAVRGKGKQAKPSKGAKSGKQKSAGKAGSPKSGKPLSTQVDAALAQTLDVWTAAYDHALGGLHWPRGCTAENSFLWSTVMLEQAEVLVRAGYSASKLSAIVSESVAVDDSQRAAQLAEVIGLMDQSLETLAFQWLDSADAFPHAALGISALAWTIPEHAQRQASQWLTQWLQAVADRLMHVTPDADESILCSLVLRCELPLLIGVATAASKRTAMHEAVKAMDYLAEYLECSVDQMAPWLAHGATYLRASLACVLRCRVLADALGLRPWFPPQQKALASLLKHAARWSRPDGTHMLGAGHSPPRSKSIWAALSAQTRRPAPMVQAMALSGLTKVDRLGQLRKSANPKRLPPLTHFSENAAGALMQSDWRNKGCRIAVDYSDIEICIEALGPKGAPVIAGEWTCRIGLEGQSQLQLDEWVQTCWFSDKDVDYLELEAKFGQFARVQRQVVLFRSERLMLLADALLCDQDGHWTLDSRLPLAGNARFETDQRTTEGFIVTDSGARCLTMPLYMPEWRREVSNGKLSQEDEELVIHNSCHQHRRLYAPLMISLCNRHAKQPFTWRRLTVGEDLRIVGPDEAVAFRVQSGEEQILIYRTLAACRRRTALGMHTLAEFFAGRVDASQGEVDTLLEVEAETVV